MKDLNVVIAQSDTSTAQAMASHLHDFFRNVAVAHSVDELRNSIPKHRADIVVLDLELAGLEDLKLLHRAFQRTRFICTHRVPDETMWTTAVDAGAEDVCYRDDVPSILRAAGGRSVAAAA